MSLLEAVQLSKSFDGIRAVSGVSFTLEAGEILACVGSNAAGKTTLINLVTGWQTPDSGFVKIGDKQISDFRPEIFARHRVVRTFQKARLFKRQTVIENLLLADRIRTEETLPAALIFRRGWKQKEAEKRERIDKILDDLGIEHLLHKKGDTLSGGEQRLVEFGVAAMRRPAILILDEPAANLSQEARQRVASYLLKLQQSGVSCLIIEHDLSFVRQVADRVMVLSQGESLCIGNSRDESIWEKVEGLQAFHPPPAVEVSINSDTLTSFSDPPIAHSSAVIAKLRTVTPFVSKARVYDRVGRSTRAVSLAETGESIPPKLNLDSASIGNRSFYETLSVTDVAVNYGSTRVVQDINMSIGPGEIVALLGGNGAGKSTIVRAILGLIPFSGLIKLGDTPLTSLQPYDISRLGLSYVSQHRKVFPSLTVKENFLVGVESQITRLESVLPVFPELEELMGLRAGNLSGGQQQIVAIARAVVQGPKIILLDEPSAGLSEKLWKRVVSILALLAAHGTSILIVEHRLFELSDLIARSYVLKEGTISVTQIAG